MLTLALALATAAAPAGEGVPAADEAAAVDEAPAVAPIEDTEPTEDTEPVEDTEPIEDTEPVEDSEPPADAPTARPSTTTDPASTHDVPADDFEAEVGVAPGGYYGHGVILERPPPDGRNRIIVGSILVPLGTIATVSSAVGTWLTVPQHCERRLSAAGIEADGSRCQGLFTFNVIRTTYGALMLGSGATILALGIIQRERYRKWRREHGMRARLEPAIGLPSRGFASVGLRVRF